MKRLLFAPLILLGLSLTACEKSLDTRYLDSSLGRSLELPPDLSQVEVDSSFELPRVFSGDDPERRDAVPVLAKVESVRLRGSGDLYWLEAEADVETLYQKVRAFWASEGYRLLQDEPVIGIMTTEWIYKEEGGQDPEANWLARLLEGESLAASQDQFRTRIERVDTGFNRVYIAHRGTEFQQAVPVSDRNDAIEQRDNDLDWRFRRSEPELEVEMLSRLMIYLGVQQAAVEEQVDNLKLFAPRAFYRVDTDENSPYLILKDPYHIAWNRIYHQLERLNFEIELSEFESGFLEEGVIQVAARVKQGENESGGGFLSLFSSSDEASEETRQFVLVLSKESHEMTRVEIETTDGELDTSREGKAFLDLLYRNIR